MRRQQGDIDQDVESLLKYLSKPRTLKDMEDRLDCDERTIFRRLKDLEARGCTVARLGSGRPSRYQVLKIKRS